MATELKLPQLGENVDSGVLARLLVEVGATVKKDQPVLELETDKATVEVPAFSDGVVKEILVKEGERVKVGQTILTFDAADGAAAATAQAAPPAAAPKEAPQEPPAQEAKRAPVPASPSVRRLARELGVDIYAVPGTGPGGRIADEDVKLYA